MSEIPGRVFLDSSTLQTLQTYGEFIYDGGEIPQGDRIWSILDGFENVDSLQQIVIIWGRGTFQLALSKNSLREVNDRGRYSYLQWALEMLDYCEGCLAEYCDGVSPFTGRGQDLAVKIAKGNFGYLSEKDAMLIKDAVLLECEVFLTMEKKLPKNAPHIERELGIRILQPKDYWDILKLWASLF